MRNDAKAFVSSLADSFLPLESTFNEHRKDNFNDVLPHILMADYCRVILEIDADTPWVSNFLFELESHFSDIKDDGISNVIALSFIEHLPPPDKNHPIIGKLGHKLLRQYDSTFGLS